MTSSTHEKIEKSLDVLTGASSGIARACTRL